jgi:hypothetical protein
MEFSAPSTPYVENTNTTAANCELDTNVIRRLLDALAHPRANLQASISPRLRNAAKEGCTPARSIRYDLIGFITLGQKRSLQVIEVGSNGSDLWLRQAVGDRLHDC